MKSNHIFLGIILALTLFSCKKSAETSATSMFQRRYSMFDSSYSYSGYNIDSFGHYVPFGYTLHFLPQRIDTIFIYTNAARPFVIYKADSLFKSSSTTGYEYNGHASHTPGDQLFIHFSGDSIRIMNLISQRQNSSQLGYINGLLLN